MEKEGKCVLFFTVPSAMVRFTLITVNFLFATVFKYPYSTTGSSWRRKGRGASCAALLRKSLKDSKINILNGKCYLFVLYFKLLRYSKRKLNK